MLATGGAAATESCQIRTSSWPLEPGRRLSLLTFFGSTCTGTASRASAPADALLDFLLLPRSVWLPSAPAAAASASALSAAASSRPACRRLTPAEAERARLR